VDSLAQATMKVVASCHKSWRDACSLRPRNHRMRDLV